VARVPGRREADHKVNAFALAGGEWSDPKLPEVDWPKLAAILAEFDRQAVELPVEVDWSKLYELLVDQGEQVVELVDQGAWFGPLLELDFGPSQEQMDEMERQTAELLAALVREDWFWQVGSA
jgi:hypothetical protein